MLNVSKDPVYRATSDADGRHFSQSKIYQISGLKKLENR